MDGSAVRKLWTLINPRVARYCRRSRKRDPSPDITSIILRSTLNSRLVIRWHAGVQQCSFTLTLTPVC